MFHAKRSFEAGMLEKKKKPEKENVTAKRHTKSEKSKSF